jgi:hypothetical protein
MSLSRFRYISTFSHYWQIALKTSFLCVVLMLLVLMLRLVYTWVFMDSYPASPCGCFEHMDTNRHEHRYLFFFFSALGMQ